MLIRRERLSGKYPRRVRMYANIARTLLFPRPPKTDEQEYRARQGWVIKTMP
jgi:hypothetical protein